MQRNLWELMALIRDAADELERASEMAVECSGYVPPTPFGDEPDPGEPGWPVMLVLSDVLARFAEQVRTCTPQEILAAVEAEKAYLDDLADRADGLSY